MPKTIRVLLFEDDLSTITVLTAKLAKLEEELWEHGTDIALTLFSEAAEAQKYLTSTDALPDILLLDRDDQAGGSFHIVDFEKVGVDRIISISSVPEWNDMAQRKGITKVVWKDYGNLNSFAEKVTVLVKEVISALTSKAS